jgi:hypothetical protein
MPSSGMLRLVALVRTDVSEELSAFFIRVTRIGELGTYIAYKRLPGRRFEFRQGCRISSLRFCGFAPSTQPNAGTVPADRPRELSTQFPFSIH